MSNRKLETAIYMSKKWHFWHSHLSMKNARCISRPMFHFTLSIFSICPASDFHSWYVVQWCHIRACSGLLQSITHIVVADPITHYACHLLALLPDLCAHQLLIYLTYNNRLSVLNDQKISKYF